MRTGGDLTIKITRAGRAIYSDGFCPGAVVGLPPLSSRLDSTPSPKAAARGTKRLPLFVTAGGAASTLDSGTLRSVAASAFSGLYGQDASLPLLVTPGSRLDSSMEKDARPLAEDCTESYSLFSGLFKPTSFDVIDNTIRFVNMQ